MKEKVLNYLKDNTGWYSPTQIGLALGKDYNSASSSVAPALKSLLSEKKIKRKRTTNVFYSAV